MNKDKNNIVFFITIGLIIVIALSIFLSIIWRDGWFNGGYSRNAENDQALSSKISTSDISKYIDFSTEELDSELVSKYSNDIIDLLSVSDYKKIYEKLDDKYIEENNLSESNIEEFLKNNGLVGEFITVEKISRYEDINNVCVYRLKIVVDYNVKFINIIETKPYKYTLDFSQDTVPMISSGKYTATIEGIKFEVNVQKKQEKAITYDIKVTNTNNSKVEFDFTSVNSIALYIKDSGFVKQTSSILERGTSYALNKDSYFTKEFYFPVNMQYHKDINALAFYNVKIGNEYKNIYIRLN